MCVEILERLLEFCKIFARLLLKDDAHLDLELQFQFVVAAHFESFKRVPLVRLHSFAEKVPTQVLLKFYPNSTKFP